MVLHLKKLESLSSTDACAKIGWNWPCGSGEEDFLISSMYFCYIIIISPWKRAGPFVWTFEQNLNPLHPRMLWAKFGWNWPCRSGEEDFLISSRHFWRKVYDNTTTTDKFWSEKLTWVFLWLMWAKKNVIQLGFLVVIYFD